MAVKKRDWCGELGGCLDDWDAEAGSASMVLVGDLMRDVEL